jgi:hypothetical protein
LAERDVKYMPNEKALSAAALLALAKLLMDTQRQFD